jgi:GNAT superfamily N-acetyltransferase
MHIIIADLENPAHQRVIVELTDAYARDPLGDGRPLADDVRERLIDGLRAHPTTLVFLAYEGDEPIGIATCFLGFSTFYARPLVNVHDLSVLAAHRGQGVGRQLLAAVEAEAQRLGCCKLTLEVLERNPARRLYESCGFEHVEYDNDAGMSLFYAKTL